MVQEPQPTTKSSAMTGPLRGIPLPDIESLPDYQRGFWEAARNNELQIQQCSGCGRLRHLPMPMCPQCHSVAYAWARMSGRGKVYSHLIVRHPVHRAIREMDQVPYNICLIELEEQEGLRILSNVLNIPPEDIYIDMPVEVTFMQSADDHNVVLPLFVPSP